MSIRKLHSVEEIECQFALGTINSLDIRLLSITSTDVQTIKTLYEYAIHMYTVKDYYFGHVILEKIAQNICTPPDLMLRIFHEYNSTIIQRKLAENPTAPPELLDSLSKCKSRRVIVSVATNPNTPIKTLKRLNDDFDMSILTVKELHTILRALKRRGVIYE
jgi:hypothetical protein